MIPGLALSSRNELLFNGSVVHNGVVDVAWSDPLALQLLDAFGNPISGRQMVLMVALTADGTAFLSADTLSGPVHSLSPGCWLCLTGEDGAASLEWSGDAARLAVLLPGGRMAMSPVL